MAGGAVKPDGMSGSIDVYSFGMLNYTLARGAEMKEDDEEFRFAHHRDAVDNATFSQELNDLREFFARARNTNNKQDMCWIGSWVNLIESCAKVEADRRPCTTNLLKHSFFK